MTHFLLMVMLAIAWYVTTWRGVESKSSLREHFAPAISRHVCDVAIEYGKWRVDQQ